MLSAGVKRRAVLAGAIAAAGLVAGLASHSATAEATHYFGKHAVVQDATHYYGAPQTYFHGRVLAMGDTFYRG